jgi:hypothetical protein
MRGYCGAMFGRRRNDDEDPFAALKEGGTYQSAPTTVPALGDTGLGGDPATGLGGDAATAPVAAPSPTTTAPVASQPPASTRTWVPPASTRSRRGGIGLGTQIGVRIAVVGVFALVAIGIPLAAVHHASHSTFSVPSFNFNPQTTPGATTTPATSVSYLTPGGLRAGLAHVERLAPGARLSLLRLDDHSLSVTAVQRHGGSKLIYLGPNGTFVTATQSAGEVPVSISTIRPAVVARLIAEMRTRFHVPARRIDYIVLSSPQGSSPSWVIFTKAPSHPCYSATLSGAGLTRIA